MAFAVFLLLVSITFMGAGYVWDYTVGDVLGLMNADWSLVGEDLHIGILGLFLFVLSFILIVLLARRRPRIMLRCANTECGVIVSEGTWKSNGKCPHCGTEEYSIMHYPGLKMKYK